MPKESRIYFFKDNRVHDISEIRLTKFPDLGPGENNINSNEKEKQYLSSELRREKNFECKSPTNTKPHSVPKDSKESNASLENIPINGILNVSEEIKELEVEKKVGNEESNAQGENSKINFKKVFTNDVDPFVLQNMKHLKVENSVSQLLFKFFCCCFSFRKLKIKKELMDKGYKKIDHDMNIMNYLTKLQEIDLLKYLLLDEEQIKIFYFLSKPSIFDNLDKMKPEHGLDQLISSCKRISSGINGDSKLNKKLIELFYSEINYS